MSPYLSLRLRTLSEVLAERDRREAEAIRRREGRAAARVVVWTSSTLTSFTKEEIAT